MKYGSLTSAAILALLASGALAADLPAALTDADFAPVNLDEAKLGQLIFYDPILSGNREVACATCHHHDLGTGDGLSLSLGDGGIGLGPDRIVDPKNPPEKHVPRNAPALFNLGAHSITALFHDGRIEVDPTRPNGVRTPLDEEMAKGFASALAAQTMFPVLSGDEMAGHYSENDISKVVRQGLLTGADGAWDRITKRVAGIPDYAQQFTAVYDHIETADDIAFTDIANTLAAFMSHEWRTDNAPFDAMLRGEAELSVQAAAGLELFYGRGGCADCHSGPLMTDMDYHAMGQPQLGPGKAASFQDHARDEGRFHVTGDPADLYAFRTPSLRNVTLTGPWGHAGAYSDLSVFVAAHADPVLALANYDRSQVVLTEMEANTWRIMDDPDAVAAIAAAVTTPPVSLSDGDVAALVAFLESLTDPIAVKGRLGVPDSVPSGLDVAKSE